MKRKHLRYQLIADNCTLIFFIIICVLCQNKQTSIKGKLAVRKWVQKKQTKNGELVETGLSKINGILIWLTEAIIVDTIMLQGKKQFKHGKISRKYGNYVQAFESANKM